MHVVLLLTRQQVLDRPIRKLSLLGILARRWASKRLKNQDAQLCSFVACRLWHRKLEEEAGGMVDAILRDTEHQVFIAWLHATYSDLAFPRSAVLCVSWEVTALMILFNRNRVGVCFIARNNQFKIEDAS